MLVKRTLSVVVAVLLAISSTALAQHQQHRHQRQGQMMGGQGAGMMGMLGLQSFSPATLLEHQEQLALTSQQIEKITEIGKAAGETREASMAGHDRNRAMLMEVLTLSEPDLKQVRGHFDAAHASMGAAHWAEINAALEAMKALTPAQREMVRALPKQPTPGS